MKPATEKQKKYILKLDPSAVIDSLDAREASALIRSLLNKPGDWSRVDVAAALAKYGVRPSSVVKDGGCDTITTGSNNGRDFIRNRDTAALKSFIKNAISETFPGLRFTVSASFKAWAERCDVTIKGSASEIVAPYSEIERKGGAFALSDFRRFLPWSFARACGSYNEMTAGVAKAIYENVYRYAKDKDHAQSASEKYKPVFAFVRALLDSLDYEHTDVWGDYGGVSTFGACNLKILCEYDDRPADCGAKCAAVANAESDADVIKALGDCELSEEERRAWAEYRKEEDARIAEQVREMEERNAEYRRMEEAERARLQAIEERAKIEEIETAETQEIVFTSRNKCATLAESLANMDEITEVNVCRRVTFATDEDAEAWGRMLMSSSETLYCRGGKGLGGWYYTNPDGSELTEEQEKSVTGFKAPDFPHKVIHSVIEFCAEDGEPFAYVDPEGHDYARYAAPAVSATKLMAMLIERDTSASKPSGKLYQA